MMRLFLLGLVVALPLRQISVTSGFGFRVHPVTGEYSFHNGVDLQAKHDTVFSITDGLVENVSYNFLSGVYIKTATGKLTASYCHLSQIFVLAGDSVKAGQPIGITGSSGLTTGEHLHLTIRYDSALINPLSFLINAATYFNQYRKENTK